MAQLSSFDKKVRWFIYDHFVQQSRPPSMAETAVQFEIDDEEARAAYYRLHENHAIFLEPGQDIIRMANPFSGIPTTFQVETEHQTWSANCAWDMIAIPAMLQIDATLKTVCPASQEPLTLTVVDGQVYGQKELIHFAVPFAHWYDDLIFT
ncbi:MAG: organomercurial lyase [Chloroflexota bacterium]